LFCHYFVASEVFDLPLHLADDVILVVLTQIVFLQQYFCETLQSQVWLVLVPQDQLLQPLVSLHFQLYLHRNESAELVLRLVEEGIVFESVVGLLQQIEFGDVHGVHARLV